MYCLISSFFPSLSAKCSFYITLIPAKANVDFSLPFLYILPYFRANFAQLYAAIWQNSVTCSGLSGQMWKLDHLELCSFYKSAYFYANWWIIHLLKPALGFTHRITVSQGDAFLSTCWHFPRLDNLVNNYIKFMCWELCSPTWLPSCQTAAKAGLLPQGRQAGHQGDPTAGGVHDHAAGP